MNNGRYLDRNQSSDPTSFCIGVSGYPEKHFEAPNMTEDLGTSKRRWTPARSTS